MPYIGNSPGTGTRNRFIYTATASQTTFSGADNNSKTLKYADSDYIDVFLNGVCLVPGTDYTASTKTSVVLTQAASLNDTLEVVAYDIASIADTVSKADGGTFEANVTFNDGIVPTTGGSNNISIGTDALDSLDTSSPGGNNVAVGSNAGTAISTTSFNTALGSQALATTSANGNNTAIGYNSLNLNTGGQNTAVGSQALAANSTAAKNVAVGKDALKANTTGEQNVAVGTDALQANTTTDRHTAVGYQALFANSSGIRNTAIGWGTLEDNTSGDNNTGVGEQALVNNTTGDENTGLGSGALASNTTGSKNTSVGKQSLVLSTTAIQNTVLGYQAGYTNVAGGYNTFVGYRAAYTSNNSANALNTCIGYQAGYSLTTGSQNCFVGQSEPNNGYGSGHFVTTGTKNTILGGYNGNQNNLDIRTSSNNIVLSDGDGNPRIYVTSTGDVKINSLGNPGSGTPGTIVGTTGGLLVTADTGTPIFRGYGLSTGTPTVQINADGNIVNANNSYGAISDQKLKENIVDSGSQWDDIKALSVRKYSLKSDNLDEPNMLGVIAQELEAEGMNGLVTESPDLDANNQDLGTTTKSVNYSILYMKAVKALQEAMARIEILETEVAALKG